MVGGRSASAPWRSFSQQFALLVVVPLLVLSSGTPEGLICGGGPPDGAIVVVPLAVMTSGHVFHAITLGTGDNPSEGGTVLWGTHAYGVTGVLLYRVAPVAVSVVLSWWVWRRLGPGALEPVALMSLVAISLGLRLVFEANLFTYYFMALAVTLALLEATRGPFAGHWLRGWQLDPGGVPHFHHALRCCPLG